MRVTKMNIWLVGDSIIRPAVQQFVTDRGAELFIDTSVANCIPEHVWCEQIHDDQIRTQGARMGQLLVVAFLNVEDYDSENTVHQIARRTPLDRQMLFLVYPSNAHVEDGPTHEGDWIKVGVLADLDQATVLSKLQELYA
jgi:hypothetical protein